MILGIVAAIAAIIVVLVVVIATRPADFRIARTATTTAAPAVVFAQVNDLHLWAAWSPWDKIDPDMKKSFEGPASGLGASYSWVGTRTGEGRMTIIECRPNELIRFKLDFVKPFQANNIAEFTFKPEGNQIAVTWSMTGRNNFFAKAFSLFMNMDKMCGREFEKGLASLKAVAEAAG